MARLKRKSQTSDGEPASTTSDLTLMEELVRASLKVNPNLRDEKSTREVMSLLKSEVAEAMSPSPPPPPSPAESSRVADEEARASNVNFFFSNKSRQMAEHQQDFAARRAAIDEEERLDRDRYVREIVDFMVLTIEQPAAIKNVLARHQDLVRGLGVSSSELMVLIERRRKSY